MTKSDEEQSTNYKQTTQVILHGQALVVIEVEEHSCEDQTSGEDGGNDSGIDATGGCEKEAAQYSDVHASASDTSRDRAPKSGPLELIFLLLLLLHVVHAVFF